MSKPWSRVVRRPRILGCAISAYRVKLSIPNPTHSDNRQHTWYKGARSAMIPTPNPAKNRPAHIMSILLAPVWRAPPSLWNIVWVWEGGNWFREYDVSQIDRKSRRGEKRGRENSHVNQSSHLNRLPPPQKVGEIRDGKHTSETFRDNAQFDQQPRSLLSLD